MRENVQVLKGNYGILRKGKGKKIKGRGRGECGEQVTLKV